MHGGSERRWPAWGSRPMRLATSVTVVLGIQFVGRWLLGLDDTRRLASLLVYGVPALLGALVLLAGFVQQRRAPRGR
jgi:hypothetical protein